MMTQNTTTDKSELPFIPLAVPHLGGNEWKYVKECLDTSWVSSAGLYVDRFEAKVADYTKARDFYADLMGMTVAGDNGINQCQLTFGDSLLIARNRSESAGSGPTVDHMSYKIEDWNTDRVRTELERRGLEPRLDRGPGGTYASFHVADPDGYDVQISGELKPGDSLYEG